MDAKAHEFAERMRAKAIPEGCTTDPSYRIFRDPPEMIQRAFGGRLWFHETDCKAVHRIGLLLGLGWQLGEYVRKQLGGKVADVNGVRVIARTVGYGQTEQLYDLYFVRYTRGEDNLDPYVFYVVTHRPGLTASQLKVAYADVLGEHAV